MRSGQGHRPGAPDPVVPEIRCSSTVPVSKTTATRTLPGDRSRPFAGGVMTASEKGTSRRRSNMPTSGASGTFAGLRPHCVRATGNRGQCVIVCAMQECTCHIHSRSRCVRNAS